jgi:competence protein ComEA
MKGGWVFAFGLLSGLLGAGILFLLTRPPRGSPVTLLPPPTPGPLVVHVAGAVRQPGVVRLAPGSRVADALQAAGGLLPQANSQGLNLAAFVQDGEKITVPTPAPTGAAADPAGLAAESSLIDINTAGAEDLERLPGIGPVMAQAIVDYRAQNGPFRRLEDIQDVPGIGPATYEEIQALITIGSQASP